MWSRHLDNRVPGDPNADCGGSMEPIAVCVRSDGEWALVHRCAGCTTVHVNRIAGDDNPAHAHAPGGAAASAAAVPAGVADQAVIVAPAALCESTVTEGFSRSWFDRGWRTIEAPGASAHHPRG